MLEKIKAKVAIIQSLINIFITALLANIAFIYLNYAKLSPFNLCLSAVAFLLLVCIVSALFYIFNQNLKILERL